MTPKTELSVAQGTQSPDNTVLLASCSVLTPSIKSMFLPHCCHFLHMKHSFPRVLDQPLKCSVISKYVRTVTPLLFVSSK